MIRVGATTTQAELADSDLLKSHLPVLSEAASLVGDPQVRNRGTLGGSIVHADPAADMPAVMVALEAQFDLAGTAGERSVAAGDFFQELFTVDVGENEILTLVTLPAVQTAAYAKLHHRASRYAIVGVAAMLDLDGPACQSARVGVTGLASHAQRLSAVEQALTGRQLNNSAIAAASARAADGILDVNDDLHASAEYRALMAQVFAQRAISAAAARR